MGEVARQVSRSCLLCRRLSARPQAQQMGDVADDLARPAPPFSRCAVDLFGPLVVKGMGGFARKTFKAWGVLFVCVATRAISIWLAASYNSHDFLQCLKRQVAVYGMPEQIQSDQGSQLATAASDLKEWALFAEEVAKVGVEWSFTPVGCAWRNGQAERAIGIAKKCLKLQVERFELLSYAELETALLEVAAICNRRPLAVRAYDDDTFFPVSPADLLLGRQGRRCRRR